MGFKDKLKSSMLNNDELQIKDLSNFLKKNRSNVDNIDPTKIIRFEVNAKLDSNAYGNSAGSFATTDPSIYAWEISSEDNIAPINTLYVTKDEISQKLNSYTENETQDCKEGWKCLCFIIHIVKVISEEQTC